MDTDVKSLMWKRVATLWVLSHSKPLFDYLREPASICGSISLF
jgi:hypothetical protein